MRAFQKGGVVRGKPSGVFDEKSAVQWGLDRGGTALDAILSGVGAVGEL